jgi:hypothetical protein
MTVRSAQISTSESDRTHARTGPDTPQAQAHDHTLNTVSHERTPNRQTLLTHTRTHLAIGERCHCVNVSVVYIEFEKENRLSIRHTI